MNRLILFMSLWLVLIAGAARAQWSEWITLDAPSITREQLLVILDRFPIPADDRERALAAHAQLIASHEGASERARLGYRRVNEARDAWNAEHGFAVDPEQEFGLYFGSTEVVERQMLDRFNAEAAFRRAVFALPSIANHSEARIEIVSPHLRRALRWMRIFESSVSPRFRDLDFLVDVVATCELSETGRRDVAPILASYVDQLLPALSEWEEHRTTLTARFREAQVYRVDLGTATVETKFSRMRAMFESDRALLERFIAINRSFGRQLLAAPRDESDRAALRHALEVSRYPEYHEPSPAHDALARLRDHPALTADERAAIREIANRFEREWTALRERLMATAMRAETSAFIARCDEARLSRWTYAETVRPTEHEIQVVIHPCEPLIIEREQLVKSTLREVAKLLSIDTTNHLDADVRLILTWAAMGAE